MSERSVKDTSKGIEPLNYIRRFENFIECGKDYLSPRKSPQGLPGGMKAPANSSIDYQNSFRSKNQSTAYELKERGSSGRMINNTNKGNVSGVQPFNYAKNITQHRNLNFAKNVRNEGKPPIQVPNAIRNQGTASPIDINDQSCPEIRKFVSHPMKIDENLGHDINKSLKNLNICKNEIKKNIDNQKIMSDKNPVESKDIIFESSMLLSPIRSENTDSKMEEVRDMRDTMDNLMHPRSRNSNRGSIYEQRNEDFYYIRKSMLEGRKILGHINPITLRFTPIADKNGDFLMTEEEIRATVGDKVLFVFIDENNLEKVLVLSTRPDDAKNAKKLSKVLMILGSIDPASMRFVPDVYPEEGFYDWESFIKGKRAMFGTLSPEDNSFVPCSVGESDYKLAPALSKRMAIIGHIDIISQKFVPKNRAVEQTLKFNAFKLNNVVLAHLDEDYPEIQIVINSKAYDYDLDIQTRQLTLIQGRIQPQTFHFVISSVMEKMTFYPNERILKKKAVIGYIHPSNRIFCYKEKDYRVEKLMEFLIKTKVILSHIDSKYPEIGYLILPHVYDEEINSKLSSKVRGVLGYIDPASFKFVPDIRPNQAEYAFLKKLIKKRAILGYIDPESQKFVKEDIPRPKRSRYRNDDFNYDTVGRDPKQILMIGFFDPNLPTLCQVITPGVKDFEVDSELFKMRTFIGNINVVQNFKPLNLIEGINGVRFEEVLSKKLEIMGYNIKELPLIFHHSHKPSSLILRYYNGPKTRNFTNSRVFYQMGKILSEGNSNFEMSSRGSKGIDNIPSFEESFKLKIQQINSSPESNLFLPMPTPNNLGNKMQMNLSFDRKDNSVEVFSNPRIEKARTIFEKTGTPVVAETKNTSSFHQPSFSNPELEEKEPEEEEEYEIRNAGPRKRIVKNTVEICVTEESNDVKSLRTISSKQPVNFKDRPSDRVVKTSPSTLPSVQKVGVITPNTHVVHSNRSPVSRLVTSPLTNEKIRGISQTRKIQREKNEQKEIRKESIPIVVDKKLEKMKKKKKSLVYKPSQKQPVRNKRGPLDKSGGRKRSTSRKGSASRSPRRRSRTQSKSKFKNSQDTLTPIVPEVNSLATMPKKKNLRKRASKRNNKNLVRQMKKINDIKRSKSEETKKKKITKRSQRPSKQGKRRKDLIYKPAKTSRAKLRRSRSASRIEDRNNDNFKSEKVQIFKPTLSKKGPILIQRRVFSKNNEDIKLSKSVTFMSKKNLIKIKDGDTTTEAQEAMISTRKISRGEKESRASDKKSNRTTLEKAKGATTPGQRKPRGRKKKVRAKIDTGLRRKR